MRLHTKQIGLWQRRPNDLREFPDIRASVDDAIELLSAQV